MKLVGRERAKERWSFRSRSLCYIYIYIYVHDVEAENVEKRKAHDVPTRNREEKRDPIKSGFFEASLLPKTGSHNKRSYIYIR